MSEPREYQIVLAVQAALRVLSTAGWASERVVDYAIRLDPNAAVEELKRPNGPRPFILLELKPDAWEYAPASQVTLTLPMTVHWVHDSVPTDDASLLLTYLRGCADIERALAADITLGGLVQDVRITGRTLDLSLPGSQVWAQIEIEARTHREFGAP